MDFLHTSREFRFRTAIDDYCFRTEAFGSADGVHCHVASADDDGFLSRIYRSVVAGVVGVHKVSAGKEFISGKNAVEILTFYAHKPRESCSGADEYCIVALAVEEIVDSHSVSDDYVSLDFHTEFLYSLHLFGDDILLRESEFGNAIDEYTADFMERFENLNFMSEFGEVRCTCESGRTTPDDCHSLSCRSRKSHTLLIRVTDRPIPDEAFKLADRYGFKLYA